MHSRRLAAALLPLLLACGDDAATPDDDGGGAGDGTGAGPGQTVTTGAGTTGAGGVVELAQATIAGDVTWQVTFDATAQAAGATNCSYTRHYEGIEDASRPWVCPSCEVVFRATVQMTAGEADCFSQVSAEPPSDEEWIGYGGGVYYRGIGPMSAQGTADVAGQALTTTNAVTMLDAPVGGTMEFAIAGSLTLSSQDGDPLNGFVPPATYACGWPKADPPAYTGDYTIVSGGVVPDGLFKDACDETVRLHDFQGSYLFINMGARDCPPCQLMAGDEEAFVQSMAMQGIEVHVITLLAPSLANPLGETTTAMLDGWIDNYSLTSPVLADRAWGLSMFLPLFAEQTGYPSWVMVDPELRVMDFASGYPANGFADMEAAILADAGM